MLANRYSGIVEPEIARLIAQQGRRLQLSPVEIDDLQQEIITKLAGFPSDEACPHSTSATAALRTMIDRQMRGYLRAKRRYQRRMERLQALSGRVVRSGPQQSAQAAPPEPTDLRLDVQAAVAGLSLRDQRICQGLAAGLTIKAIAAQLPCDRDTVARAIPRIREAFTAAGLLAWVDPNYDGADRQVRNAEGPQR